MAYMTVDFSSNALRRRTQMTVILPIDKWATDPNQVADGEKLKTLYLLHGIFGDQLSWPSFSRIQMFAEAKNMAVVIPSGENGFYIDHPDTYDNYATFCGQEIVEVTRKMFPLSRKREDTFIGGFSMGGYGAIRLGLMNPDTFGYIIGLSNGFVLDTYASGVKTGSPSDDSRYMKAMFGDPDIALNSDIDPRWIIKKLVAEGKDIPKIFLGCGTEDFLVTDNDKFDALLNELGVEHTYHLAPGGHEWVYWDREIQYVIDNWLPLNKATSVSVEEAVNGAELKQD